MAKYNPFPPIEDPISTNLAKLPRKHLKNHKLRNNNYKTNQNTLDEIKTIYKDLVYQLYKLRMTDSTNLEAITKLEFELMEYTDKYKLANIDKINATLSAVERYYNEARIEEELAITKRRGITIYEDLSYKLHKTKVTTPNNIAKIKKLEAKLNLCKEKYQLSPIVLVDAHIKALQKYDDLLLKKEADKKQGINIYKELIIKLHELKKEKLNLSKINEIESKIKKCSNEYNLNNLDKINIQFQILEENN